MNKRIKTVKQSKKIRGVRVVVFCGKCKRDLTEGVCHTTKENRCPYSETHAFKYYLNVPNGKGKRIVKVLNGVANIEEAQKIALNHKLELKKEKTLPIFETPVLMTPMQVQLQKEERPKVLLKELLAKHLDVLSNYNVASHLQRSRSKEYLNDIKRGYRYLIVALKTKGYDIKSLSVDDINDDLVGAVHDYLLDKKGCNFSNRSYSKHMQFYATFLQWCIEEQNLGRINYFKKVPKRITRYNPEVISKEGFEKTLNMINMNSGKQTIDSKIKPYTRNLYRDWLPFAFKFSLETGRRRSEIVNIKWSSVFSKNTIPVYIKVEDSKVSNIMGLGDTEKKFVYVPVTKALYELIKQGFEEYLRTGEDGYIVAQHEKVDRDFVADILSRSFSHYYKLAHPDDEKQLKFGCLRKTYLTSMEIHTKGQTAIVSGHGSGGKIILNTHYIDPKAIASVNVSEGFYVFKQEQIERKQVLNSIRKRPKNKGENLEK